MQFPPEPHDFPAAPQASGPLAVGLEFLRVLGTGWVSVIGALARWLREIRGPVSAGRLLFLAGCLIVITTTLLAPWIVYQINLTGLERPGRGSNYRILFFLPGLVGFACYAVGGRFRLPGFLAVAGIAAAVYLAGFFFTNPVHTLMRDPAEYALHPAVYVYGGGLLLSILTALQALRSPAIQPAEVRSYLLDRREASEPLNPELFARRSRLQGQRETSGGNASRI